MWCSDSETNLLSVPLCCRHHVTLDEGLDSKDHQSWPSYMTSGDLKLLPLQMTMKRMSSFIFHRSFIQQPWAYMLLCQLMKQVSKWVNVCNTGLKVRCDPKHLVPSVWSITSNQISHPAFTLCHHSLLSPQISFMKLKLLHLLNNKTRKQKPKTKMSLELYIFDKSYVNIIIHSKSIYYMSTDENTLDFYHKTSNPKLVWAEDFKK